MGATKEAVPPQEGFRGDPASDAEVFKIGINSAMPVTLQHSHRASHKPHSDEYRFVQDLRALNDLVHDIHPTVPSPYILLTMEPGDSQWFSVLDWKDAFFCIPKDEQAQLLFAFEWQDPETKATLRYRWAVLPQGSKSSSSILGRCWQET